MESTEHQNRLENFPISFFSIVMGLSGLTVAWEKAQHHFHLNTGIGHGLLALTVAVFIVLVLVYSLKIIKHRGSVSQELMHPIKLSFFPSISISFLLLSIAFLSVNIEISKPLWMIGMILHFGFTLFVISRWMHHEHFKINHMNPAWFIPAVGNVLVPVTGVALGYIDVSWFFFSIGMLFWIILLTIFFNRILFHEPIPKHLLPTLFIMIAPPAVGFIAYVRLNGGLDHFAHFLYYVALFLTFLLLSQAKYYLKLPFFLSWWAYSFPLAAITIASFVMFEKTDKVLYLWLAISFLILVTSLVGIIIALTLKAIMKKKVCVAEG